MWFRKSLWNRTLNTAGIVPRTLGAWLHAVEDATKTALYWVLDPVEWIGKTAKDIKTAVNNACTTWPRYHRLRRAPVSLLASPLMLAEWVGETLRYTWCNLFRNVRKTIANPFINIWHGIKRIGSDRKVWEFKFEKINKETSVSPKMKLAKWFDLTPPPTPTP